MFKTYGQVRDWLESFIPEVYGKEELGLARIEELLRRLGNPEKKFKSVHVAGTSGKGSAAFYIARLLQLGNFQGATLRSLWQGRSLKIGLHVSPHLSYIGERMQINGRAIAVSKLVRVIGEMRGIVEQIQKEKPELTPSYFEILVAASFLYFAQEKVDFAVVEVGLGGRLDATNVLTPEVSVITNTGLDHTDILGKTVEKIAFEKAGVVKRGVPIVTGANGKALEVIRDIAKQKNAPLVSVLSSKYYVLCIGKHCTKETAALAVKTVETLGFQVTKEQIEKAFSVGFPGRFEEIMPRVVLDGAHNPEKVRALIKFVRENFQGTTLSFDKSQDKLRAQGRILKITLVLAFKKGKDWKKMVDLLVNNLHPVKVCCTMFNSVTDTGKFASVDPKEITDYLRIKYQVLSIRYENSQEAVFDAILDSKFQIPDSLVLATGSLYLVGEVRAIWKMPLLVLPH